MATQPRPASNGPQGARWRVPACLALLCTIAYLPPLIGLLFRCYPFGEDALAFFVPQHGFAAQCLHRGIVPLWDPHLFCGASFAGNIQTGLFYPPNTVYVLFAAPVALLIDAWAHTIWLAFGSFLLGREMKLSRVAACMVGVLLALGGATSARIYAGQMIWLQAHSYVPWVLWALHRYLRSGRSIDILAFSILLSGLILCGHPPTILFCLVLCFAVLAIWLFGSPGDGRRLPKGWPRALLGASALCLLLTAVVILPFIELNRWAGHSSLSFKDATVLSGTWKSIVRLALPDFFGGNSGVQWSSRWGAHEEVAYLGVVPLLMAMGAPFFIRQTSKATRLVWLSLPLILIVAMGANTPLYELLFNAIPLIRVVRVPARWLDFWIYAVAFLSGFAVDSVFVGQDRPQSARLLRTVRVTAVVLAVVLLAVAISPIRYWNAAAQAVLQSAPAMHMAAVAANFRYVALISVASSFLLLALASSLIERWQKAPNSNIRRRLNWALVGLMSLDLLTLFWRSAKIVTPKAMNDIVWPADLTKHYKAHERWDTAVFWQGIDRASLQNVDIYNGYDPLGTKRYFDFVSADEGKPIWEAVYQPARRSLLLAVAGVSHTIAGPRDPNDADTPFPDTLHMSLEAQSRGWTLWRHIRAPWPRQYLARKVLQAAEPDQLLMLEALAAHPYSAAAVVRAKMTVANTEARNTESNRGADMLTRVATSPNRVRILTTSRAPRLLVVSESMFPGWKSFVNGKVVPTQTANYLFRGVAVGAGRNEVDMIFDTQSYRFGLFLSLCGVAVATALCTRVRRRRNLGGV